MNSCRSGCRAGVLGLVALATLLLAGLGSAAATPTQIAVRVLAKGAKFVGTSMGGVRVTIRDADTGEILADGVTRGSTGDTDRIMVEAHAHDAVLSTEGAALFTATLEIDAPRWIEITAFGPLAQRQGANRISVTQWIVPEKHLTGGDGVLLELPGVVVDILSPAAHARMQGTTQQVELRANVVMMCGCPLYPDGLWDPARFEIEAILVRNGETMGSMPLHYAGTWSQFAATWEVKEAGTYEAIVYAHDPANGNTGLDRVTFLVRE
ncbi:MAG: hypothetical protein JSW67_12860 [Candidatus Latescibacterota bacterium]|nr:MAG: hypothetical protein JSW67_12860 [Candidatus Latescibacterota bacterium]